MKILKSLRWKLTLWFVLLLTAIFLVLGIFVYASRRQALYEKFDADLHLTALSISSLLALGEDNSLAWLESKLSSIDPATSFFIYDATGKIILRRPPAPASAFAPAPASSLSQSKDEQSARVEPPATEKSSDPIEPRLSELFRDYRATQLAGPVSYTIKLKAPAQSHTDRAHTGLNQNRHPESGQLYRVLFYYLSLPPEDEVPAVPRFVPVEGVYLALVKSSYPIDEDLEALGRLLIISGLFLLALSTAGGLFLSSRALRPVHQITSTLKEVSSANLDLRIKEQNFDRELIPLVEQLNAALDRLQLAFERERRFTADSSHELRTPLAAMINELEVLVRKPRSAQDYQRTIGEVLASAQEMKNILEDLLLLAKMEAGQKSLDLRPVNLRQMIDEVWSRVQTEVPGEKAAKSGAAAPIKSATTTGEVKPAPAVAPEAWQESPIKHDASIEQEGLTAAGGRPFASSLKFYNQIDPALVIRANSNHLRRAWLNLLKNAINYNEPDGEIHVSADRRDDKAIIAISNTGPGIPPDKLPFIFDRFFRANHYYSEAGGAGLGLSIARTIIEFHGGTIRASSQPGLTTFEITLPL